MALLMVSACAGAQERESSREELRAEVQQMEGAVAACKAAASGCDAKRVVDDERVGGAFVMQWYWLRDALAAAQKAKDADRVAAMDDAAGRLQEIAEQSGGAAKDDAAFAKARAKAAEVLAGKEFQAPEKPSWLDQQWTWFWSKVGEILYGGFSRMGSAPPWAALLLEWGFYVIAAVGLLVFVRRSFLRQRLAVSLGTAAKRASAWDKEATDWAEQANACALKQEWRDAVHCLYWAAIVRLESRRAWRHNPARTPREYVRLLKPGSPQRGALGGLTQIFERVWYGLREASDEDYAQARGLFDGLNDAGSQGVGIAGNG